MDVPYDQDDFFAEAEEQVANVVQRRMPAYTDGELICVFLSVLTQEIALLRDALNERGETR